MPAGTGVVAVQGCCHLSAGVPCEHGRQLWPLLGSIPGSPLPGPGVLPRSSQAAPAGCPVLELQAVG